MKPSVSKPLLIMAFLVFLTAAAAPLFAPAGDWTGASDEIEGVWRGLLRFSGVELRIIFTISRSPDGGLTATMDVPEQNAKDVPVDTVLFDRGKLHLEIAPIEGIFEGRLSANGRSVDGSWIQSGLTLPLTLERLSRKPVIERPQEPREPFPYRSEEVVFRNDNSGVTLAGTLTRPSSEGPFPALLLLSGSGPQDRDESAFGHRPFLVVADALTRRGMAVLRVDDRGTGGSTGDFDKATAVDLCQDAGSAVAYLKSRPEIDPNAIGLLGHSEGGMIAAMTAARSSEIAFIVLAASPGLPIREMEYSEMERALRRDGADDGLVAKSRSLQDRLFNVIVREADIRIVRNEFAAAIREFFSGLSAEERETAGITQDSPDAHIHYQVRRLHSPWFRFYLSYDPGEDLRRVACPVLAVNGDKDFQVASSENLAAIEAALKAGGNKNFTIKELPGLNHLLQNAKTGSISEYGEIEETIAPTALRLIGDWILRQLKHAG